MQNQAVLVRSRGLRILLMLVLLFAALPATTPVQAVSADLVISQVYGGGGNTGAPYNADFIEIFNRGTSAVSLAGKSLQYASATGTGNFGGFANQITELPNVILQPGQFYLVQEASGAVGSPLPTPDLVDTSPIAMAAAAGKVVLVNSATTLGCNGGSTPCNDAQKALIIDLVGFGGANFYETAPTPVLSNTTAALRNGGGTIDTDNNLADFTVGAPSPRNFCMLPGACPTDTAPTVSAVVPAANAVNVLLGANLTVAFSEDVNAPVEAFALSCATSGAHTLVVSGGPATYTLDPDVNFTSGESCTLTVNGALVTDVDVIDPPDTMEADFISSFTAETDICALPTTTIGAVQGSGDITPFAGQNVTVQGVVTGDFQGAAALNGFFLQDITVDGDPATSDGVFVFVPGGNPLSAVDVVAGDVVVLTGKPKEFNGLTEFDNLTALKVCGQTAVPAPVVIDLPETVNGALEALESMYVTIPETLTVDQNFFQGRYGQVTLSSDGRLVNPTNAFDAGSPEAIALADENARRLIVLDDGKSSQNPNPIPYIGENNTLRAGDVVNGVTGLLDFGPINNNTNIRDYRIQPTMPVSITRANPRPTDSPEVGGNVKVAGANVLNYFTTYGSRGANNAAEFERQAAKIVAELVTLNADVVGLMEIESNGDVAAANLVDRLNAATAPGTYAYVADPATGVGSDQIKVAIIYQPARVTPFGASMSSTDPIFDRAPVAQTFTLNTNGAQFSVVVNHFKSKSSCPTIAADPNADQGDGQGCWNAKRVQQAQALIGFISTVQQAAGDMDVMITGDLNAYAQEDPVQVLLAAGYTDLVDRFNEFSYSYVFDGAAGYLDHALVSPTMNAQATGAAHWHINADEPSVIDYNLEFKPQDLYAPDMYRASDHDPVVAGFQLANYAFSGFLTPVLSGPEVNKVNSGQSVPLRFSLGGDYGLGIFAASYPASAQVACGSTSVVLSGQTITSKYGLTYDPLTGLYQIDWKTEKGWKNTCRQLVTVFADGSLYNTSFQFVK